MAASGRRARPDPAALRPLWGEAGLHDTHVHLDADAYAADPADVVAHAAAAGVTRLTTIGIDRATSERALTLAATFPAVTAAIGFHPNAIGHWVDQQVAAQDLAWLEAHVGDPGVIAIGEIGLDYYWQRTSPELQAWACLAQIEIARRSRLPIIIHNRDADDDLQRLLAAAAAAQAGPDLGDGSFRGVLHCFSGDWDMAERCLALGFHIGIGGPVTYSNPRHAVEVAMRVPLDRLLLETDAPYLAPVPYRGKQNEPAYTVFIAEKIASVRGLTPAELAAATTANAARLFGLPPPQTAADDG